MGNPIGERVTELAKFFSLHRKYLLYNLLMRNLKVRYRKSFLGFLWTLIVPLTMTLVYYFVFQLIARMGDEHFALFLLVGVIPWTFFSTSFATGTDSLVNNFPILSKVPISSTAFPLADTCSAFINFLLSLPVLLGTAVFFGVYPAWSWLCLPLLFIVLFFESYCLAFIAAVANVYLRDVRHLVGIGVQIWMYLTPILYSVERIPEAVRPWFYLNPFFVLFDSFHKVILQGQWPAPEAWLHLFGWTALLLAAAFTLNMQVRYKIVERI